MKKLILILTAMACFNTAYAENYFLGLDLKINSDDVMKLDNKTGKFMKLYSLISSNTSLLIMEGDVIAADLSEPRNQREENNDEFSLQVVGNDMVRIIDQSLVNGKKLDINVLVKAKIEKNVLGKIKNIKISKEDLAGIYNEVYTAIGFGVISNLNLDLEGAKISSQVELSGLDCTVNKDSMNCISGVKVKIEIDTEE